MFCIEVFSPQFQYVELQYIIVISYTAKDIFWLITLKQAMLHVFDQCRRVYFSFWMQESVARELVFFPTYVVHYANVDFLHKQVSGIVYHVTFSVKIHL